MNVNTLFPSKYLKADDLGGHEFTLTIHRMVVESVGAPPQQEDKPVLYFERAQKGLILNRTNAMMIAALYGPETDNWPGKRVTLFSVKVKAFGAWHDAIRVKEIKPPPPKQSEPDPAADLPGDDIDEASELLDGPSDLDVVDNPFEDAPEPAVKADLDTEARRKQLLGRAHGLGTKLHGEDWPTERPEIVFALTGGVTGSAADLDPSQLEQLIAQLAADLNERVKQRNGKVTT